MRTKKDECGCGETKNTSAPATCGCGSACNCGTSGQGACPCGESCTCNPCHCNG